MRTAYRNSPELFLRWPAPRVTDTSHDLTESLIYFLQLLFRKQAFREKQIDVIIRALERKSVLGLLPTGGGKSAIFQLATLLSPGVAIVIAPLKSLIDDQEDNLHRAGINRVATIHSGLSLKAKIKAMKEIASGTPRFVYVAPERLQIEAFRAELSESLISHSVVFMVVDEAHCVSEWGHNFRPAYLNVARIARSLYRTDEGGTPIIALTGTASNSVLIDIQRELEFDRQDHDSIISVDSFDRPNLHFLPISTTPGKKSGGLIQMIECVADFHGMTSEKLLDMPTYGGLIFCRHGNGAFGVCGVSSEIRERFGSNQDSVRIYAGAQPKCYDATYVAWEDYKRETQRHFKESVFPMLVATSSFGMGVDKSNIRYALHYGIPGSIEALAQEAGRAGRIHTETAACAIVFTDEVLEAADDYLAPEIDAEEARRRHNRVPRHKRGDAHRVLHLHFTSYPGVRAEVESTKWSIR